MTNYSSDPRVVMTLDAGGTNFVFSAMQGNRAIVEPFALPSRADHLPSSLEHLVEGFTRVKAQLPVAPSAISFAFPGPADYPGGIITAPPNLTAWRDVPLGPFLAARFGVPVYINNDGDLFAYGEASAGFLPYVNGLLEEAGSPKRYRNLLGVTLGTGFGGGIVCGGELFLGDNSAGGEVWLLRHKLIAECHAEEGASIRAVRRVYGEVAGLDAADVPEPKIIFDIAEGRAPGDRVAAREAFRRMGEVAGDAIAEAVTLLDCLVVIGGGIAGAHPQFLPSLVDAMSTTYTAPDGKRYSRLIPRVFNLEDPAQRAPFFQGEPRTVTIPGTNQTVQFDALKRTAVGISRLGTSQAAGIGAYAFALARLDESQ